MFIITYFTVALVLPISTIVSGVVQWVDNSTGALGVTKPAQR